MNIAVIFAGGVGSRMNSKEAKPKQFLEIHGKPIIIHTLELFEYHTEIDAIVIACVKEWMEYLQDLISKYNLKKVKTVVPGGSTGQGSIYQGLLAAKEVAAGEKSIVLIHDGVRPLINKKVISENIASVKSHGSAITSVTVKETVLVVSEDGAIDYVPSRAASRLARAPQSFWLDEVFSVHQKALQDGITDFIDTCTMMQHYGKQLYLVEGPQENIKITTPDDFYTMRALLDARENAQIYGYQE
ncbi:MAG: IspD/TarI family cytidylyltransferase [Butyribacter sp.]|nr:IspD/TarI family cytidylyltransferase [bacterium]MDY3853700.1 IspD/TarI family cytidylyltransferase [Butyribacter sp.]